MNYSVHSEQTIFDLCLQLMVNGLDDIFAFMAENNILNLNSAPPASVLPASGKNPVITAMTSDRLVPSTNYPAIQTSSGATRAYNLKKLPILLPPSNTPPASIYSCHDGQTIFDVCLQVMRNGLQDFFTFLSTNPHIGGFKYNILAGDKIVTGQAGQANSAFLNYVNQNRIVINTGETGAVVYGQENETVIYESEDGEHEYIAES